jgi:uncharacterized damage-inducible protein DinB
MDLLDRFLGHDRWTTSRVLEMCRGLTDEQLDQRFDIGLETLRATFDHMIFNVAAWTQMMLGEPINHDRSDKSIPGLIERHERAYDRFAEVARRMQVENRLSDRFLDGYNYSQEIGATIVNVITHNHHHRGEVLHILKRLGFEKLPDGDPQEWEHANQASG